MSGTGSAGSSDYHASPPASVALPQDRESTGGAEPPAVVEAEPALLHQLLALRDAIAAFLLIYGVATLVYVYELALAVGSTTGGSFARFKAIASGDAVTFGSGLQSIAALACIATSLVWQYRATRNTIGLSSDPAVMTPSWAIIWWFVPLMFLVKPFTAVGQLWRISTAGRDWRAAKTPWRLVVWWGLFWLLTFLYVFIVVIISEQPADQVPLQLAQAQFVIVAGVELAGLLVAGFWAHIVSRVSTLQHGERFRSMHAAVPAAGIGRATLVSAISMPAPIPATAAVDNRPNSRPDVEPAAKRRTKPDWRFGAAAVVGGLVIAAMRGHIDNSPQAALRCVERQRHSSYIADNIYFVNSCSRPLNIRQCDKIVLEEFLELFGSATAKWHCDESFVRPGGIGAISLAARKDNSLLVTAFTNSRWKLEACFAPQSPASLDGNQYQCK